MGFRPLPRWMASASSRLWFQVPPALRFPEYLRLHAKDQGIQRNVQKLGKLYEHIHRTSLLSGLGSAQKTLVNIYRLCKLVLGVSLLDAKVLYVRAAALHVIMHCVISNLKFLVACFEIGDHGYSAMYGCQRTAGGWGILSDWVETQKAAAP